MCLIPLKFDRRQQHGPQPCLVIGPGSGGRCMAGSGCQGCRRKAGWHPEGGAWQESPPQGSGRGKEAQTDKESKV